SVDCAAAAAGVEAEVETQPAGTATVRVTVCGATTTSSACLPVTCAECALYLIFTHGFVFEPVWCRTYPGVVTVSVVVPVHGCCVCTAGAAALCAAEAAALAAHCEALVAGITSLPSRCDECALRACTSTVIRCPL